MVPPRALAGRTLTARHPNLPCVPLMDACLPFELLSRTVALLCSNSLTAGAEQRFFSLPHRGSAPRCHLRQRRWPPRPGSRTCCGTVAWRRRLSHFWLKSAACCAAASTGGRTRSSPRCNRRPGHAPPFPARAASALVRRPNELREGRLIAPTHFDVLLCQSSGAADWSAERAQHG